MPMAARGAIPVVLPSAASTKFAMQYFSFMLPTQPCYLPLEVRTGFWGFEAPESQVGFPW